MISASFVHYRRFGPPGCCTDFRKPGSQDEYYDIDFWVDQTSGKLAVKDVKIHKVPVQEDGVCPALHLR